MSKELIFDLPVRSGIGKDTNYIRIDVSYILGGRHWATGKMQPRGYYVGVQPMTKTDYGYSFEGFSGYRNPVEKANRFSQKTFEKVATSQKVYDLACRIINVVLQEQGLEIVGELPTKFF